MEEAGKVNWDSKGGRSCNKPMGQQWIWRWGREGEWKLSHVIEDHIKNNDILLKQTSECSSLSDLYENKQGVYVHFTLNVPCYLDNDTNVNTIHNVSNDSNNDLRSHVIHIDKIILVDFNVSNYLDNDTDVNTNVSNDLNNDISSHVIQNDTSVNNVQLYQMIQLMYVNKLFCHPTKLR